MMEETTITFELNYPNNYGIFVSGYHVGYLEVRLDSNSNPTRYDFDDLLTGYSIIIQENTLNAIQDLITRYYHNMISCKHYVVAGFDNIQLIEQIEHHQIPFSQVVFLKPVDAFQYATRILFFQTDEAASLVRLLS